MSGSRSHRYEVVVGNIGNVYTGGSGRQAIAWFGHYKRGSRMATGRASGERVTLMKDHEIVKEYMPAPKRFRLRRQHKLAMMLYTAGCWHGDTGEGPVAMLSLSSTRKVHSEEHRRRLESEIAENIKVCVEWVRTHAHDANLAEIRRLADLWGQVRGCRVGEEWLTDSENLRYSEELHRAGLLDNG